MSITREYISLLAKSEGATFTENKRPLDTTTIKTVLAASNLSETKKAAMFTQLYQMKHKHAEAIKKIKAMNISFPLVSPQLEQTVAAVTKIFRDTAAEISAEIQEALRSITIEGTEEEKKAFEGEKKEFLKTATSSYIFNLLNDTGFSSTDVDRPTFQFMSDMQLVFTEKDPMTAYDKLLTDDSKRIRSGFNVNPNNEIELNPRNFVTFLDTLGEQKFKEYLKRIIPTYTAYQSITKKDLDRKINEIVSATKNAKMEIQAEEQNKVTAKVKTAYDKKPEASSYEKFAIELLHLNIKNEKDLRAYLITALKSEKIFSKSSAREQEADRILKKMHDLVLEYKTKIANTIKADPQNPGNLIINYSELEKLDKALPKKLFENLLFEILPEKDKKFQNIYFARDAISQINNITTNFNAVKKALLDTNSPEASLDKKLMRFTKVSQEEMRIILKEVLPSIDDKYKNAEVLEKEINDTLQKLAEAKKPTITKEKKPVVITGPSTTAQLIQSMPNEDWAKRPSKTPEPGKTTPAQKSYIGTRRQQPKVESHVQPDSAPKQDAKVNHPKKMGGTTRTGNLVIGQRREQSTTVEKPPESDISRGPRK